MTTIKPIGTRAAMIRSLAWGTTLTLLGGLGGYAFLLLMAGSLGALGNGGFLLIPFLMAALYGAGLASAIGLVVTIASRISTIGFPPALAIAPGLVLLSWAGDLSVYAGNSILLRLAASPALTVTAMAVAVAWMRPMRDWRSCPAAIAFVVLASLAMVEPLMVTIYRLTQWNVAMTVWMTTSAYLPFTWASRQSGIPAPFLYLLSFAAATYWQRTHVEGDERRTFSPVRLGWPLVAGIAVASLIGAWVTLKNASRPDPYLVASSIVPLLVTSTWIYWLPIAVGVATWRAWPLSHRLGLALTAAAAFPLLSWAAIWGAYALTPTPDYNQQPQITWNLEAGRSYAVLLPTGSDSVTRELRRKGYQDSWTGSSSTPGKVDYWRPATKERFMGGDSVEISRVAQNGAASRGALGTDAYYAYVTEDGRTRFVGSMVYPSYKTAPSFPPHLKDATLARIDAFASRSVPRQKGPSDVMADMISTLPDNRPR